MEQQSGVKLPSRLFSFSHRKLFHFITKGRKSKSFGKKRFETRFKTIIIRSFQKKKKLSVWQNQLIEANEVCIIFLTAQLSVHASVGTI